ncbi:MAG: ribonuclease HI family protein [Candidatus Marsarchaeota archaeon]|nr:ribonuclease HI family protein [Candidatus Marsarchaeota archaeon]
MRREITIYTDGASRGNPGPSASGFAVYEGSRLLKRMSKYNGIKTNNFAEYTAIMLALRWCANNTKNPKELNITLYSDSELVVRQINGEYKVRSAEMKKLNEAVHRLKVLFGSAAFFNRLRSDPGVSAVDKGLNELLDRMESEAKNDTNKY